MATFRCKKFIVLAALAGLACVSRDGSSAPLDEAKIQKTLIEHVTPRRDYVGKHPSQFEWTGIAGVESYTVTVENEVEVQMFEQGDIKGTSTPWPADLKLEPGTYFWRITGSRGGRMIADSGRAAFLIREP